MKTEGSNSRIDFAALTKHHRDVLGAIAINEDGGHRQSTLISLERRGLIEKAIVPMGGHPPMVVWRYSVPIAVHIQWCEWCSRQK